MPVGHRVIRGVAGCRAGQETGSSQAAGHQHHRHGLAVRQMQHDLLIIDWTLRPSASQSVVFDGALLVCVCVCPGRNVSVDDVSAELGVSTASRRPRALCVSSMRRGAPAVHGSRLRLRRTHVLVVVQAGARQLPRQTTQPSRLPGTLPQYVGLYIR